MFVNNNIKIYFVHVYFVCILLVCCGGWVENSKKFMAFKNSHAYFTQDLMMLTRVFSLRLGAYHYSAMHFCTELFSIQALQNPVSSVFHGHLVGNIHVK